MRDALVSSQLHPLYFIKNDNRTGSKAASKTFRRLLTPPSRFRDGYQSPKRRCSSRTFRYGYLVTT